SVLSPQVRGRRPRHRRGGTGAARPLGLARTRGACERAGRRHRGPQRPRTRNGGDGRGPVLPCLRRTVARTVLASRLETVGPKSVARGQTPHYLTAPGRSEVAMRRGGAPPTVSPRAAVLPRRMATPRRIAKTAPATEQQVAARANTGCAMP